MVKSPRGQYGPSRSDAGVFPLAELALRALGPLMARRAAMRAELLAHWPEIIGERLGSTTRPERVKWSRGGKDSKHRPGILVLACEPAFALEAQHEAGEIIGAINRFLGHEAIGRITIVQKPVLAAPRRRTPAPQKLSEQARQRLDAILADVTDPQLRESLARLGRGVFSRRRD